MFSLGMPSASTVDIGMRSGVRINHHSLHGHPIHLCFNIQWTVVEGVWRQHVIIGENDRFQLLASHSPNSFSHERLWRIEDHDSRQGFHSISPNGFGEAYFLEKRQEFFILLQPFFDRLRGINPMIFAWGSSLNLFFKGDQALLFATAFPLCPGNGLASTLPWSLSSSFH